MCRGYLVYNFDDVKVDVHDTDKYMEIFDYFAGKDYIKFYGSATYIFKLIDENGILIDNTNPEYKDSNNVAMTQKLIDKINEKSLSQNGERILKDRIDEFTRVEFIDILKQVGTFSEVNHKKCYADYLSWMQDGRTFTCSQELSELLEVFNYEVFGGKDICKMLCSHVEENESNRYIISKKMKEFIKFDELDYVKQSNYIRIPYFMIRDICRKHLTLVSE